MTIQSVAPECCDFALTKLVYPMVDRRDLKAIAQNPTLVSISEGGGSQHTGAATLHPEDDLFTYRKHYEYPRLYELD